MLVETFMSRLNSILTHIKLTLTMIAIQFSKITLSAYRTAVETVNQIELSF